MTGSDTLYPALDRFFENKTQMAHAANRSKVYLWQCLTGRKEFTRADKKAISANIIARLLSSPSYEYQDRRRTGKQTFQVGREAHSRKHSAQAGSKARSH